MAPLLREAGHVGYVNLNTIVNEAGIWPLEFTCRFGYPGYSILEPLQATGWGELLRMMIARKGGRFATRPGFSVGVVLSTPPFPYSRKEVPEAVGLPIILDASLSPEDLRHVHYGEAGLIDGQLVTSGLYGWTMVVTGVAADIEGARHEAYARCRKITIPNLRYRTDIGKRLRASEYDRLVEWGLLG
jgi:phosphoribosylamine--glycine ligase